MADRRFRSFPPVTSLIGDHLIDHRRSRLLNRVAFEVELNNMFLTFWYQYITACASHWPVEELDRLRQNHADALEKFKSQNSQNL